jgi:hypothetical protein
MTIATITDWRKAVIEQWTAYDKLVSALKPAPSTAYIRALALALAPVYESGGDTSYRALLKLLGDIAYGKDLHAAVKAIGPATMATSHVGGFAAALVERCDKKPSLAQAIESLIIDTGVLAGAQRQPDAGRAFSQALLAELRGSKHYESGLRVVSEMVTAQRDVNFAARDINIVQQTYAGNPAALKSYLGNMRTVWSSNEINNILPPAAGQPVAGSLRLHHFYTPMDVWSEQVTNKGEQELIELRARAVLHELDNLRVSVMEMLAIHPLLVVTGAPGTGKSTLCQFVATSLAYAADKEAETRDGINGLEMLGPSWVHGAILPIYVRLQEFARSTLFPTKVQDAKSRALLDYIRQEAESFGPEIEAYLTGTDSRGSGAILILDGLDEVRVGGPRLYIQKMVEQWALRFPNCRVLVTSRTVAYRPGNPWRLDAKFVEVELAPYTFTQMKTYITNWYRTEAGARPQNFGGRDVAEAKANEKAQALIGLINDDIKLRSLVRQPLLLTLVALIHDRDTELPRHKAELYESTVKLLQRWNIPTEREGKAIRTPAVDHEMVRRALQIIAFDLQREAVAGSAQPEITRDMLANGLKQQHTLSRSGRSQQPKIDELVNHIGTRNGILVFARDEMYRFLHQSIQEYLAACALIEQYDELSMPLGLKCDKPYWTFPENVCKLLLHDPDRWRETALYAGAILANRKGQDERWQYIEELLPKEKPDQTDITEPVLFSIYVAAEVWAAAYLKARLPSHNMTRDRLRDMLELILTDSRLDVIEQQRSRVIFDDLKKAK